MSGSLLLDQIPNDYRTPGTYIRVRPNYSHTGLLDFPAHGLIVAQMLSTGIAQLGKAYPLYSTNQARKLGGVGSIAAQMAKGWFDTNPYTPVDIIFLPDAVNATKASTTMFLGGFVAATPLSIPFRIADTTITTTMQVGQSQADLQAALIAAVNNLADLPVTAAAGAAGTYNVVLTAKHAGLCGNVIDVSLVTDASAVLPAGVSFYAAIAPSSVTRAMLAGGLGNPDVGGVFAAISTSWYTDIVIPWTDTSNIAEFAAELTRRYTASVRQDAHGYVAYGATLSAAISPGLGSVNCPYLSPLPMQGQKTLPWVAAAAMAAFCCYRSAQDPALQMRGGLLPNVMAPDTADIWNEPEQNQLLHNGGSTYEVTRDGSVVLQRVITTYTTSTLGAPDTAWLDIMAAKVATRIRWDWRNYISLLFPSNKLTDDGSRAAEYDPTIATPNRLRAAWIGRTVLYIRAGWIEDDDAVIKSCTFTRDPNDPNRVNSTQPYRRIGNLMLLDVDLQFEA